MQKSTAAIFVALACSQFYPAIADRGAGLGYDPFVADQFPSPRLGDTVPTAPEMRTLWARNLAFDATIYGQSAVLIYRQAFDQAMDPNSGSHVGFNRFLHGRTLAGPDYAPFKTPNADTLYSNAYLDLRQGPVMLDVPNTNGRYYTANFLDPFGNATNISARTHGMKGGKFLIAPSDWHGDVPAGRTVFRVAASMMWILLRVLATDGQDMKQANALQDQFVLKAYSPVTSNSRYPDGRDTSAAGFFRILDFVLRESGYPAQEAGLVHRFEGLGIAGRRPLDNALADQATRKGMEQGYLEALDLINSSIVQNGRRVGTWSEPVDVGRYGQNYLYRAAVNTLGTGGNVIDENYPFTTFSDANGQKLLGSHGPYELHFPSPPPARFFWSVTVYDAATRTLFNHPARKYLVSDRTKGLVRRRDGSITICFENGNKISNPSPNSIPVPDGEFYVAIRAQGPLPDLLERRWTPPAIRRVKP